MRNHFGGSERTVPPNQLNNMKLIPERKIQNYVESTLYIL